MNFQYELDDGRVVDVEGTYLPAERGVRDSLGVPEEPDWSSDFEITSIKDETGVELDTLSHEEYDAIAEEAIAQMEAYEPADADIFPEDDPEYDCGPLY